MACMSEEQLRCLTRRQLQTLAKQENIRPANATSEKLIKRLLDKFFGKRRRGSPVVHDPPVVTVPSSPSPQHPVLQPPVERHFGESFFSPHLPLPVREPSHRPRPSPTSYIQSQLDELTVNTNDPSPALTTMERLLPIMRHTSSQIASALKDIAWQGYYAENDLLSPLKTTPGLWDGTRVMPPGDQRDKWVAFLDAVKEEYRREGELAEVAEMATAGGIYLPRHDSDAYSVGGSSISTCSGETAAITTVLDSTKFFKHHNDSTSSSFSID
ncbi:hypothetical protein MIND_00029600 [Mycena indigotica]|uniref:Uncharacterized protein n=1 Tax=Mycena indigotica TaxID=2126181 RepID=A0A8H6WET7_9AGAR|nr:uncharacterized protein MIND_00029600 [Mycena indigotica]KAF7315152.1 hypothetical protein MIND_00029600 [Mycena indigotica]